MKADILFDKIYYLGLLLWALSISNSFIHYKPTFNGLAIRYNFATEYTSASIF